MASKISKLKALMKADPELSNRECADMLHTTRRYARMARAELWEEAKAALTVKIETVDYDVDANWSHVEPEQEKDNIVGFFTDIHEPAAHPRFFEFVRDTFKAHGVTEVVCGGDLIDHHFISRHTSEPEALSPVEELQLAIDNLKKWTLEFPEVKVCIGNHDTIPARQAKELGIPSHFLRDLNEVYGLPKGWKWAPQWEIDGVIYEHGMGATGQYGMKNLALAYRQSVVCGHTHSNGGVLYLAGPKDIIFGANGGCGIDIESYAMRYGANYKYKPTLGCVIVKNGKEATFVPMDMDKYGRSAE